MIIEVANVRFNVIDLMPGMLSSRAAYEDYIRNGIETDVDIKITSDEIDKVKTEFGETDDDRCIETAATRKIYETLLDFDAFVLHAASLAVNGKAYAFSASQGTGKSTHMNLWKRRFNGEYQVVNGDRTIFRRDENGTLLACGSPWCGKEKWQTNIMVPVQGICYIERARVNRAYRLEVSEAYARLLNSTLIPQSSEKLVKLMNVLDWVSKHVPVFVAEVNMETTAADVVYEAMQ